MAKRKGKRNPFIHPFPRRKRIPRNVLEKRAGKAMVKAIRAFRKAFDLVNMLQ